MIPQWSSQGCGASRWSRASTPRSGRGARTIWAPCILAAGVVEYFNIHRGFWGVVFGFLNIFSWSALGIGLWLLTRKWMDARFGRVHSDNSLLALWLSNFWLFGYLAMSYVDDHYALGVGWPSARFLFIGAGALWCAVRLWPYSVHYLVVAAVVLGAAMPFAGLRGEAAIEQWGIQAFVATLFAWTAAGLIDLALLFRVLPPRPAEKGTTADA